MTYDYDFVCIGSGPAGQRGAVQAAKLGKRAAVIEKRRSVGGVCVETGTIPSKTFREAVLFFAGIGGRFDRRRSPLRPENRPTAEHLLARVAEVVERESEVVEDQLRRNDVVLLRGVASFKDPHTLVVRGNEGEVREVTSAHFLVATGTTACPPPGVAEDGEVVLTSDAITSLPRLPRRLVVVGGGVIGIEYAGIFAAIGVEVTVVEQRSSPLEFLDREIVDELLHQMRHHNVTFRLGEAVRSVKLTSGPARAAEVELESGKRIVSEMVLFSAGRNGATRDLGLEAAGLQTDGRGRLQVDERFRTAVPHIFAAGDVIGYPSLAATSSEQGRLAARFALGAEADPMPAHFPVGIYSVPEISTVGANEQELTRDRIPYEVGVARYREIARGQILGDDSGFLKLLFHRDSRKLLGAHIIGTQATELVHIGQAVLALGGGIDYFLRTVFNYPTLAECYKVAALGAANRLDAWPAVPAEARHS